MQRYHDSRNTYKQTARYLVGEMLIMKVKEIINKGDYIHLYVEEDRPLDEACFHVNNKVIIVSFNDTKIISDDGKYWMVIKDANNNEICYIDLDNNEVARGQL